MVAVLSRLPSTIGGSKTVVSQPAAALNVRVANSMTYGHCGNNLFVPASVFNKLAEASKRNIRESDASGSQKVGRKFKAILDAHLSKPSMLVSAHFTPLYKTGDSQTAYELNWWCERTPVAQVEKVEGFFKGVCRQHCL
jgi:hypothetical protein